MTKLLMAISAPLLLAACTIFPEFNPPEESQARAPRTSRPAERVAPVAKPASVVYDSGIWLARAKPQQLVQAHQPARSWEIADTDRTLKQAISRWSAAAGWQLVWELDADYALQARTSINGSFEDAMEAVAMHMENAEVPMKMIFYKQNKVVRIVARGAQ